MSEVLVPLDTVDDLLLVLASCQSYVEALDIADAHRNFVEGKVPYSPLAENVLQIRTRLTDIKKDHLLQEYDEGEEEGELLDEEEYVDEEELDNFDDTSYNEDEG